MGKSGKIVMVIMESLAGTGHKVNRFRAKTGNKVEMIHFDPIVQENVLYKEFKKIRTIKSHEKPRQDKMLA